MKMPKLADSATRFSGPSSNAWAVPDRAFHLQEQGRDIIHLSIGDPDLDTPEFIRAKAVSAMNSGRTHYSAIPGETVLRTAICQHAKKLYGKNVEIEQTIVMPGAQSALFATFMCIAGPGQEVILLEPAYATYDGAAMAGGSDIVRVPLDVESNFGLDVERIKAAANERTTAILLNSPGNPTGIVFNHDEVARLLEFCRDRGIWLVSDEVYSSLVYDGDHVSPFEQPGAEDHVIVINSVSKSYAMTGWRVGWVIAPKTVVDAMSDLAQCSLFGVCQFSQDAAAVALTEGDATKKDIRRTFRRRRDTLYTCLSKIDGISVYEPDGGMFLLAGVSATGLDGESFANALLDDVGVSVVPGSAFGESVRDFVRIGFLSDDATLKEASRRIQQFVNGFVS